jgi:uncharacterized protein
MIDQLNVQEAAQKSEIALNHFQDILDASKEILIALHEAREKVDEEEFEEIVQKNSYVEILIDSISDLEYVFEQLANCH